MRGSRTHLLSTWVEQWQDAACVALPLEDQDAFFAPKNTFEREQAKLVCLACPIRLACLAEACEARIAYGIWGGFDEDERSAANHSMTYLLRLEQDPRHREQQTRYRRRLTHWDKSQPDLEEPYAP